ncbi:hypothetical protein NB713_001932 [Xanthomonas sacchari]|nr:hypothetical protein [Xanthomonas sacchari]
MRKTSSSSATLKPLSPRERGWGEGTEREAPARSGDQRLRPYPLPPLRGTFPRKGGHGPNGRREKPSPSPTGRGVGVRVRREATRGLQTYEAAPAPHPPMPAPGCLPSVRCQSANAAGQRVDTTCCDSTRRHIGIAASSTLATQPGRRGHPSSPPRRPKRRQRHHRQLKRRFIRVRYSPAHDPAHVSPAVRRRVVRPCSRPRPVPGCPAPGDPLGDRRCRAGPVRSGPRGRVQAASAVRLAGVRQPAPQHRQGVRCAGAGLPQALRRAAGGRELPCAVAAGAGAARGLAGAAGELETH